jgi:hypothetical protein
MSVTVNDEEADVQCLCDVCGVEIQDQTEGAWCPVCERIFCLDCSADHPIVKVRIREDVQTTRSTSLCVTCVFESGAENIRFK